MTIETSIQPEAPKEIERKFKVKSLPENLESYPNKEIKQGYISITEDGTETRVRQKGSKFYHTVKSTGSLVREEKEKEITIEEFDSFWSQTEGRRVEKTRYEITLADGTLAELDIYGGDLEGLQMVEVEFTDEQKALEFIPPEWFGEDVTSNESYRNSSLAVNGNPENKKEGQPSFELEKGVEYLKNEIEARKNEQEGPIVVLIAGGSASGKTSAVADKIHRAFSEESIILSLDDYYRGRKFMEEMAAQGINYNYDQPEVINLDLFNTHLNSLKSGQPIEKPIYNFSTGEAERTDKVLPQRIIIVEGLFALNEKLLEVGDIKVFVEVGTHGRLIRRILRDIESRGQNPDDILSYFAKVVEPMHDEYIQSTKKEADIVISNEYNPEVEARGMKEIQLKFTGVIEPEKLRKLGAERIGSSIQVDTYYNPKDRDLQVTGEILRIREESGHIIVSYKGPKQGGDFRVRPKIDFEISTEARDNLIKMYGEAVTVVKKDRTVYQLNGVTFDIDKVIKIDNGIERDLGNFMEIRGINSPREEDLKKIIELLGFKMEDGDKRAYSEM
jgi:adenylate cyclase